MVRPAGECMLSLEAMLRLCVMTVFTDTLISEAISLLDSPLTMPITTSRSRGLSSSVGAAEDVRSSSRLLIILVIAAIISTELSVTYMHPSNFDACVLVNSEYAAQTTGEPYVSLIDCTDSADSAPTTTSETDTPGFGSVDTVTPAIDSSIERNPSRTTSSLMFNTMTRRFDMGRINIGSQVYGQAAQVCAPLSGNAISGHPHNYICPQARHTSCRAQRYCSI